MQKIAYSTAFLVVAILIGTYMLLNKHSTKKPEVTIENVNTIAKNETGSNQDSNLIEAENLPNTMPKLPEKYVIENNYHVFQTFNNCGPATLSIILNFYGKNVTQQELGSIMRPYQNSAGDNDDKSIFSSEFVEHAKTYGMEALYRPNGTEDKIKQLLASDIPVVIKTWLNNKEDIGHFRILKGYDETKQIYIQDDSYEGKNLEFTYEYLDEIWQPFNYEYFLVYTKDKEETVKRVLGEEFDEQIAWQKTLQRAQEETGMYATFNASIANYHLGNYEEAINLFEQVENRLPGRMLWYHLEPYQAYQQVQNYDRVFELTDRVLNNHNRAFSELYIIRGEAYLEQGNAQAAKEEFEKAILYNQNSTKAKEALNSI